MPEARIREDEPLRCGKLQIEFDETSQMQRLRFGVMVTEAVFSVLDTCQSINGCWALDYLNN